CASVKTHERRRTELHRPFRPLDALPLEDKDTKRREMKRGMLTTNTKLLVAGNLGLEITSESEGID
ncbi:hypothetical protein PFISCL1PPCAC_17699, partial [Pristionchus fissidentatus]